MLSKVVACSVYYKVSIEISPAPNLYCVEFEFERRLGVSLILPATCELAARLRAFTLFPEYRRTASRVSVSPVSYVELNWQTGRTIVVKDKRRPEVPVFPVDELKRLIERKKREEEATE